MHKQADRRIFILNEPNAPRLNPALAIEIGLNESLMLLQIEYWISISNNVIDGRRWTYQSIRSIREKSFPFWSISTINRAIQSLRDAGYIIEDNYNEASYDKTRWFALNYEKLGKLKSIQISGGVETRSSQNETRSNQNETRSSQNETTIPEITTEITTEIENNIRQDSENPDDDTEKFEPEIVALTDLLINKIQENNHRAKVPKKNTLEYGKWLKEMQRLVRIGPPGGQKGYNADEVKQIILFCQTDTFWKSNILSVGKLREKVITLENQMKNRSKGGVSNGQRSSSVQGRTGPSAETERLERIAKEKGLIGDGGIDEPDIDY